MNELQALWMTIVALANVFAASVYFSMLLNGDVKHIKWVPLYFIWAFEFAVLTYMDWFR